MTLDMGNHMVVGNLTQQQEDTLLARKRYVEEYCVQHGHVAPEMIPMPEILEIRKDPRWKDTLNLGEEGEVEVLMSPRGQMSNTVIVKETKCT